MALLITNYFGTTNTNYLANRSVEWIACHYTAGTTSKKGSALNLASCYKAGSISASSDFTVDDATVVQYNKDIKNRYTWGVGGNLYPSMSTSLGGKYYGICKNSNCINIEVCSNKVNKKSLLATDTDWYFTDSELDLTAQLIAKLMKEFNIDINHVIMHHEVTGKLCPAMWTQKESQLVNWYNFKKKVESYYGGTSSTTTNNSSTTTTTEAPATSATYKVVTTINGYISAADAMAHTNPKTAFVAGTYYEYKRSGGSINISKTAGSPGAWINPADNVVATTTSPTYEVVKTINGYVSASDAISNTNAKTTLKAGTYYEYKRSNGAINISKTAGSPGSWINPADNVEVNNDTAPSTTTEALPKIGYATTCMKATVSKSGEKTVKGATHFKYKEFADPASDTVVVNKELVRGLEIIYDYLNLSKMIIVMGNKIDSTTYTGTCKSLAKHKNGFGADVYCYDASGHIIPSHIICCVAQKIGFNGIASLTYNITHLDIRKESSKLYYDATLAKAAKLSDFFEYYKVTQADINAYAVCTDVIDGTNETKIMGRAMLDAVELTTFIKNYNSEFSYEIANAFIKIGEQYGVRGDIALCQSCVETGYFKYVGSAVTPDQHNYCGLGVTSNGMKGCSFDTIEKGVEAQIQHLFAYASTGDFPAGKTVIDPRFNYVSRGCAPRWVDLNQKWSSTNIYGQTILSVYNKVKDAISKATN